MGILFLNGENLADIPKNPAVKDDTLRVRPVFSSYVKCGMAPVQSPIGHDPVIMVAAGSGGVGIVTALSVPGEMIINAEKGAKDAETGLRGTGISI